MSWNYHNRVGTLFPYLVARALALLPLPKALQARRRRFRAVPPSGPIT